MIDVDELLMETKKLQSKREEIDTVKASGTVWEISWHDMSGETFGFTLNRSQESALRERLVDDLEEDSAACEKRIKELLKD